MGKAAVNAPQSKRFAKFPASPSSRQRLDCGGFSTALAGQRLKSVFNRGKALAFIDAVEL
jgi:hypothetical protein